MSRGLISRKVLSGEVNSDVSPFRGDHFDQRITITAYRGGDQFLFGGHILRISGVGLTASVVGTLSLTDRQLQCLTKTCDWLLADLV